MRLEVAWTLAVRVVDDLRPRRGESPFLGMTCVSCHAIRGTKAAGTAGSHLTHLASRGRIGGEVAPNDDAHVLEWCAIRRG